jgi:nitric oxide reductase NorD protein
MSNPVTKFLELAEMEETVGGFWHRFISRKSSTSYADAAVALADIQQLVGVYFRALGGDGGLEVVAADATSINARRSLLQRMAGSHKKTELAWRDENSLRLPPVIACFPEQQLNRDLYLWLAALAVQVKDAESPWFSSNQEMTNQTLARFPGLKDKYHSLVQAHIQQRPAPDSLPAEESVQERAIQQALLEPGSVQKLPQSRRMPQPVPLWLHPNPPIPARMSSADVPDESPDTGQTGYQELKEVPRKQTEKAENPEKDRGLITVRMENIFTWGEHVNVDRGADDEDDEDRAEEVARDLDQLAITRNDQTSKTRLKFDLDLPSESEDDHILNDGILLPEWDWKQRRLIPDHCRIVEMLSADASPTELPARLGKTAKKLRNQFQALAPARVWYKSQPDGQEVDLDAYLRFRTDQASGHAVSADNLYRELRSGARDLACLLLADLSLSTDTWVNNHARVIDVIQDSLFLFAESLAATGDAFGIYGFSSRKRDPIRVHTIKTFEEKYNNQVRGRIAALKPGYYTRMGAGIRHATELLKNQAAGRRLLLILTDGKPNDLDQYEGRYGIEDTRHAVQNARLMGFHPFCVTIDEKGSDYLPHLFGAGGYVVIHNPTELPAELPLLYARLTAESH